MKTHKRLITFIIILAVAIPSFLIADRLFIGLDSQEETHMDAMGIAGQPATSTDLDSLSIPETRELFTQLEREAIEMSNIITVTQPNMDGQHSSPLEVYGSARMNWYFEGSAPFVLIADDDTVLARGVIEPEMEAYYAAQQLAIDNAEAISTGEMEYPNPMVPFRGSVEFTHTDDMNYAILILGNSNQANLEEGGLRTALRVPVIFPYE